MGRDMGVMFPESMQTYEQTVEKVARWLHITYGGYLGISRRCSGS
jgi:hypothetical protein